MVDAARRQRIVDGMNDPRIQAIVDEAPPPPKAAIELLKANGFPLFRRPASSDETEAAA